MLFSNAKIFVFYCNLINVCNNLYLQNQNEFCLLHSKGWQFILLGTAKASYLVTHFFFHLVPRSTLTSECTFKMKKNRWQEKHHGNLVVEVELNFFFKKTFTFARVSNILQDQETALKPVQEKLEQLLMSRNQYFHHVQWFSWRQLDDVAIIHIHIK